MDFESNQIQDENVFSDVTEEENLFEDVEEETAEPTEETEAEETPKSFLRVKYNGEEKELNEEDARTYAQKGMNYDRIYEPLERLARANNMTVGDYLNQLDNTQKQYEISQEIDAMREDSRYEGVSDEILEEIATSRVNEKNNIRIQDYEQQRQAEAQAEQETVQRDVNHFLNEYPQFRGKPNDIDPKVYEYVAEGYTLLEAYEKFLRQSPSAKTAKQNEENKRRSLGNTSNAGKVETDDFLSGFLNG